MHNKVLVTGADGFIGSHLTELLVRRGYDVRAFVQYNSFGQWGWLDNVTPEIIDNFEVVAGDIRDTGFVEKAAEGVDVILHLAALIAIPYSYSSQRLILKQTLMARSTFFALPKDVILSTSSVLPHRKFTGQLNSFR